MKMFISSFNKLFLIYGVPNSCQTVFYKEGNEVMASVAV